MADVPQVHLGQHVTGKPQVLDVWQVVNGNNPNQHYRQLSQVAETALFHRERHFSSAEVTGAVCDLSDSLNGTQRQVLQLDRLAVLVIKVGPLVIERQRDA